MAGAKWLSAVGGGVEAQPLWPPPRAVDTAMTEVGKATGVAMATGGRSRVASMAAQMDRCHASSTNLEPPAGSRALNNSAYQGGRVHRVRRCPLDSNDRRSLCTSTTTWVSGVSSMEPRGRMQALSANHSSERGCKVKWRARIMPGLPSRGGLYSVPCRRTGSPRVRIWVHHRTEGAPPRKKGNSTCRSINMLRVRYVVCGSWDPLAL